MYLVFIVTLVITCPDLLPDSVFFKNLFDFEPKSE